MRMRSIVATSKMKWEKTISWGCARPGIFLPNDEVNVPIACILTLVGPLSLSWLNKNTNIGFYV